MTLPFSSLSDNDFLEVVQLLNNDLSNYNFSNDFDTIDNIKFYQFDSNYDRYGEENNPDLNFFKDCSLFPDKCKYHHSDAINEIIENNGNISMCCLNINSIPCNLDKFQHHCLTNSGEKFSIISFVETKLNSNIESLYNIASYKSFFNHCHRNSGGLAIYVKNTLDVVLRNKLFNDLIF